MNSSVDTIKASTLTRKKEKDTKGNTRIFSSRINFEDPKILKQTRTLLANLIRANQISQANHQTNQ